MAGSGGEGTPTGRSCSPLRRSSSGARRGPLWSRHWRTPSYFEGHPFLTADAAEFLVHCGVVLVGIDSYNIDDTADNLRPVHTALLGHGIPIVEHMTGLEQLPPQGFRFFAVPVQIKGFGSFPVRAFAMF